LPNYFFQRLYRRLDVWVVSTTLQPHASRQIARANDEKINPRRHNHFMDGSNRVDMFEQPLSRG